MNKILYQDNCITKLSILTNTKENMECIIDTKNYNRIKMFKWRGWTSRKDLKVMYVQGKIGNQDVYLHRLITSFLFPVVDHINLNGLDNREINLRGCLQNRNICNRKLYGKKEKYKGIHTTPSKSYHARITVNSKSIYLGCYRTSEQAARAYDMAAVKHFGEFALTNFPRENYEIKIL